MKVLSEGRIQKGSNKIKRELYRLPLISKLSERTYQKRLHEYSHQLPAMTGQEREIVDAMNEYGVFSTTLSNLALPQTNSAIKAAQRLLASPRPEDKSEDKVSISAQVLNEEPDLLLWAANESLLNVVENYIGLPIYYLGVEVRQEFANGKATGVRQWHIDTEDRRMLKIIIYLNDVDIYGISFEYISKELTQPAAQKLKYNSGLVSDEAMSSVVPESSWVACTGPAGTATFVDPCNIFHRAKPPAKQDRFSITYHYTSQYPTEFRNVNIFSGQPFIRERLTERQLKCLMW